MDFLSRTIGSFTGPSIPYNIGESVPQNAEFSSIWTIHDGTRKSDNMKCTIFVFNAADQRNRDAWVLARNMVQRLKTLRIPGVVKILDSVETDTSLIVATEHVQPLYKQMDEFNQHTKLWGLSNVAKTLEHMSSNGFVHGNIHPGSIFVNDCGEWLIGGLEVTSSVKDNDSKLLYASLITSPSSVYAPPEVRNHGWQQQSRDQPAIDAWQYGVLAYELFNGGGNSVNRNSRGKVPPGLWAVLKTLLVDEPKSRMSITKFKAQAQQQGKFEPEMTQIEEMLASLAIASLDAFNTFLGLLQGNIDKFPAEFLHYKVLPQLIEAMNRSEKQQSQQPQGGGNVSFYTTDAMTMVVQLGKGMKVSEDFNRLVTPAIVKMFNMQDRAIRLELLQKMPEYIGLLDKKIVSDKIFPPLSFGFTDTEPRIREFTLKSVIHLVEKLNDRILNGDLLRMLAKTQNDSQPEIRANTTVLLGKISDRFSTTTRTNVLIAAFARALKDPFVQSRLSALLALSHTAEYYTLQDICNKVIGALAPSLIDKDKAVRRQAQTTMNTFMTRIQAQADKLDQTQVDTPAEEQQPSKMWNWAGSLMSRPSTHSPAPTGTVRTHSEPQPTVQPMSSASTPTAAASAHRSNSTLSQAYVPPVAAHGAAAGAFGRTATSFGDTAFDEFGEDDEEDDPWGQFDDSDLDEKNDKSQETVGKKVQSMSLEPEEDDDVDEDDAWGW